MPEVTPFPPPRKPKEPTHYCTFCGRSQHEVHKLMVASPASCICDGCTCLALQTMAENPAENLSVAVTICTSISPILAECLAACSHATEDMDAETIQAIRQLRDAFDALLPPAP